MPRSKKTSKLRVTGLGAGNSPVEGEFPTPMASNAGNVFIWWRHQDYSDVKWNQRCLNSLFDRLFSSFLFKHKTRKHQSSTSLAFVRGIHGWSLDSVPKGPVIRKMFPFLWRHYVTDSWDLPSKAFSLLYPNLVNVVHGYIDLINSITLILFRKHVVLIVLSFRKVPLS